MRSEPLRPVAASDVAGFAAARGADGPSAAAAGSRAGGMRHGRLRIVHPDGSVRECRWRFLHPDGLVEDGRSVRGLLDGDWVLRDRSAT